MRRFSVEQRVEKILCFFEFSVTKCYKRKHTHIDTASLYTTMF